MLYVYGSDDGRTLKIVVNAPFSMRKQPDEVDVVINAYKIGTEKLKEGVKSGVYELLGGDV